MDRKFSALLFLICMCGKVTIVDWVGEGVGEVVGICRKFSALLFLICVCGKFTIVIGVCEGWWDVLVHISSIISHPHYVYASTRSTL